MPLNLSANDGDFTPYIKYNAKAGRFYVRPQGATEDIEIDRPRLAFDMENIKTGWIFYAEGSGPEKVWDPSTTEQAPRPSGPKKFKRGFEVLVYGNDPVLGLPDTLGLREFSSTANNVINTIVQMYAEYEREVGNHPGCVPFYACTGVKPISGAYGTNYEPHFALKAWVQRSKIPAFDEHLDRVPANKASTNGVGHYDERNPPPVDDFGLPPVTARRDDFDQDIPF